MPLDINAIYRVRLANLTRYHGVIAPNSPFRRDIVPGAARPARENRKHSTTQTPPDSPTDQAQPTAPLFALFEPHINE